MKSASQPTVMKHLGKFSQSSVTTNYPYNISESSDLEFSNESPTSIESPPPFRNPYTVASTSSISFMGNPVHESSNINAAAAKFGTANEELSFSNTLQKRSSMDAMREMIFRIAMMQPIHIDHESVKLPKRKNVKISTDPQSVAARHRRERISEKIRILQRLVPGGTKMDTASMLDEAAHYLKFLKKQVQSLEQTANSRPLNHAGTTMATILNNSNLAKACQRQPFPMVGSVQMLSWDLKKGKRLEGL